MKKRNLLIIILSLIFILTGCTSKQEKTKTLRDNTPQVYLPTLGNEKINDSTVELDISNRSCGYIMLNYKGTNEK